MTPENLVHGVCRIVMRDGVPTPALGGTDDAASLDLRDVQAVLHVFPSAAEASAFMAGIALLPSNDLRAVQGVAGAERVVLVTRSGSEGEAIELRDHGGVNAVRAQAFWYDLAQALPDGFSVEFGRDGAHPTFVVGGTRRFGLALYEGWIKLTTKFRANNHVANTMLVHAHFPSDILYDCKDKVLTIEAEPGVFLKRLSVLRQIDEILTHEEDRDVHNLQLAAVRQDPKHCAIVEKMLSGWALSSVYGSVSLVPPNFQIGAGPGLRRVTRELVSNLEAAEMIRRPRWLRHAHRDRNFHFEVGAIGGTAVRRPEQKP